MPSLRNVILALVVTAASLTTGCSADVESDEPLEKEEQPFTNQYNKYRCTNPPCPPTHEELTVAGLHFLKSDVQNYLALTNARFDLLHVFGSPSTHFDDCYFKESAQRLADNQREAVASAMYFPRSFSNCSQPGDYLNLTCRAAGNERALDKFAEVLHTVQDFYSHTNWVEWGEPGLVDDSLAEFRLLDPYTSAGSLVIVEGDAPGWGIVTPRRRPYPASMQVRAVNLSLGVDAPALISGRSSTSWPRRGHCPTFVGPGPRGIRHDDLAKDWPSIVGNPRGDLPYVAAYGKALSLALKQTTHEWCRFQKLVYDAHGASGIKALCDNWIENETSVATECPTLPPVAQCPDPSGGGGAGGSGGGICVVTTTCESADAKCGIVVTNCGGTIDCGSCQAPDHCANNHCTCAPADCAALGAECGPISDGCHDTLFCGTCSAPLTCEGGGVANRCGCTPTTCVAHGANCDSIPDGCGGTLACGACAAPQVCGGLGVANQCGEPLDLEYAVYSSPNGDGVHVDDGLDIYRNGALAWSGHNGWVAPRFIARRGDTLRFVAYDDHAHGRHLTGLYLAPTGSTSVQFLAPEYPHESFTDATWHAATFYDASFTVQVP